MPLVYGDITEAFGNTPLVRLNRVTEGAGATVLAKLEFYNPTSSVKDRLAISIVDDKAVKTIKVHIDITDILF